MSDREIAQLRTELAQLRTELRRISTKALRADVAQLEADLSGHDHDADYASITHDHDASDVVSGTLSADRIPTLEPSKINGFTAWTSYSPSLTATTTNPTLGTGGIIQGRYIVLPGKLVVYRFYFQFGTSGVDPGSGGYRLSLPVTASAATPFSSLMALGTGSLADWSVAGHNRQCRPAFAAQTQLQFDTDNGQVSHNNPMTWDVDDRLGGFAIYQAA